MTNEQWFENTSDVLVSQIVQLEGKYRTDSLVCAIEQKIMLKDDEGEDISEGELTVLAVEAMEREVNNGGFSQFFQNSSWRLAPYLPASLLRIGAYKTKELVDQAIGALGIGSLTQSTDISNYYQQMQDAVERDDASDKLDELDSKYYDTGEDIAGLLFEYIKNSIEQFK